MPSDQIQSGLLKRIILHSAKTPIIYLIIGIVLSTPTYFNHVFPFQRGRDLLTVLDKTANIFIAFALLTFAYNLFVFLCLRYEQKLAKTRKIISLIISSSWSISSRNDSFSSSRVFISCACRSMALSSGVRLFSSFMFLSL